MGILDRKLVILLAVFMLAYSSTSVASDPLTGLVVTEGMKSLASDFQERAQTTGQFLLMEAAIQVNSVVDRIETVLGDKITRPIEELDQTLKNELAAARFTVESIQASANMLPACVGNEGEILMANLKSGLASTINSVPFLDGAPIAYVLQKGNSGVPYTVVRDPAQEADIHIVIRGANLWTQEEVCDIQASIRPVTGETDPLPLAIRAFDQERLDLAMKPDISDGEWIVDVEAKTKGRIFGCRWPNNESVSSSADIRSEQSFVVSPRVTPICKGYEEKQFNFSGSCTNGSCSGTKQCNKSYEFQEAGWVLQRYSVPVTSNKGGNLSHDKSGNSVIVRASAKSKNCAKLGQKSRRIAWNVHMVGRRTLPPKPQAPVKSTVNRPLSKGDSASFDIAYSPHEGCELEKWSLGGMFSSGERTFAIADVNGSRDGSIVSAGQGVKLTFNGTTRTGTVEVAPKGCLDY